MNDQDTDRGERGTAMKLIPVTGSAKDLSGVQNQARIQVTQSSGLSQITVVAPFSPESKVSKQLSIKSDSSKKPRINFLTYSPSTKKPINGNRFSRVIHISTSGSEVKAREIEMVPNQEVNPKLITSSSFFEENRVLSQDAMTFAVNHRHPRQIIGNEKEKFGTWEADIGKITSNPKESKLTMVEREIGIGITLYFRQMKFFSCIFLLFTLISLPAFVLFYFSPTESSANFFFNSSIGHLGHTSLPCREVDLSGAQIVGNDGEVASVDLKCSSGKLSFLIDFGLGTKFSKCPKYEESDVGREIATLYSDLATDKACNFQSMMAQESSFGDQIAREFRVQCLDKEGCSFRVKKDMLPDDSCWSMAVSKQSTALPEEHPTLMIMAQCLESKFKHPLKYVEPIAEQLGLPTSDLSRHEIGWLLASIDLVIVIIFMLTLWFQETINRLTVLQFKDEVLSMSDFSVEVTGLPASAQHENELVLKAQLWKYFEAVLKETPQQVQRMKDDQRFEKEIIDIFFGFSSYKDQDILLRIKELHKKIGWFRTTQRATTRTYTAQIQSLEDKVIELEESYLQRMRDRSKADSQAPDERRIVSAFVVFRSMEGQRRALKAHERDSSLYGIAKRAFCLEKKERLFLDSAILRVEQAVSPELIKWTNLGVSTAARAFFSFLNLLLTLAILAISTILVVGFNRYKEQLASGSKTYIADGPISEEMALEDFSSETSIGIMEAYCKQQEASGVDIGTLEFSLDNRRICSEIESDKIRTLLLTLIVSIILASLNPLSCILLQKLAAVSRWKTMPEQTFTSMSGTLFSQYLNIAVVLFLVNFKLDLTWLPDGAQTMIKRVQFFNGDYEDFTVGWFSEVAPALCMTMIMQVVIPQIRNAFPYLIALDKRWVDRRFSKRNSPPATRQTTQEDFVNLYTGKEYNIAYSYATLQVVTFITLTFSSALPILYPIAFLYYLVSYWADKYLMLNYYRHSETFDELVPMKSLGFFKLAIVCHGLVSIIILSNQQIFLAGEDGTDSTHIPGQSFVADLINRGGFTFGQRFSASYVSALVVFYSCYVLYLLASSSISSIAAVRQEPLDGDNLEQELEAEEENQSRQRQRRLSIDRHNNSRRNSVTSVRSQASEESRRQQVNFSSTATTSRYRRSKMGLKRIFGIYRDDFYDEIQASSLIYYFERCASDVEKLDQMLMSKPDQWELLRHLKIVQAKRKDTVLKKKITRLAKKFEIIPAEERKEEQQVELLFEDIVAKSKEKKHKAYMTGGIKTGFQSYDVNQSRTYDGVMGLKADLEKALLKEADREADQEADKEEGEKVHESMTGLLPK